MRRFAWWQVLVTLLVGPLGVGMVLNVLVSLVLAMLLVEPSALGDVGALTASLTGAATSFPVVATSLVITALGFAGGPLIAARLARVPVGESLGLSRRPHPAALLLAPVGILALGPTSDVLVRLARELIPGFTMNALGQIEQLVGQASVLALLPFLALCPGVGEEILFRGFIQRAIGRGWLAITVSALTFALIHLDPHHVIGVVPLGFYLAWVAARTDSTWVTIVAHVANNAVAILVAKSQGGMTPGEHASPVEILGGWLVCAFTVFVIAKTAPVIDGELRSTSQ